MGDLGPHLKCMNVMLSVGVPLKTLQREAGLVRGAFQKGHDGDKGLEQDQGGLGECCEEVLL